VTSPAKAIRLVPEWKPPQAGQVASPARSSRDESPRVNEAHLARDAPARVLTHEASHLRKPGGKGFTAARRWNGNAPPEKTRRSREVADLPKQGFRKEDEPLKGARAVWSLEETSARKQANPNRAAGRLQDPTTRIGRGQNPTPQSGRLVSQAKKEFMRKLDS
jgi:hypothetical protein